MESKEIVEILKTKGLDVSEELAVEAVKGAFEILRAMLPKLNATTAIVVGPMLMTLEPMLLGIIDKIDGKDNPDY